MCVCVCVCVSLRMCAVVSTASRSQFPEHRLCFSFSLLASPLFFSCFKSSRQECEGERRIETRCGHAERVKVLSATRATYGPPPAVFLPLTPLLLLRSFQASRNRVIVSVCSFPPPTPFISHDDRDPWGGRKMGILTSTSSCVVLSNGVLKATAFSLISSASAGGVEGAISGDTGLIYSSTAIENLSARKAWRDALVSIIASLSVSFSLRLFFSVLCIGFLGRYVCVECISSPNVFFHIFFLRFSCLAGSLVTLSYCCGTLLMLVNNFPLLPTGKPHSLTGASRLLNRSVWSW